MKRLTCLALILLAACSTDQQAQQVRTVTVSVPVATPCKATKPVRPAPLAKPLPTDLNALVAALAAKLGEYALPGEYADQVDAFVKACG